MRLSSLIHFMYTFKGFTMRKVIMMNIRIFKSRRRLQAMRWVAMARFRSDMAVSCRK